MTKPTEALSFGAAAADYDRYRPRYPEAAVRWAVDGLPAPARVVDLGAGTGILTRGLLALGHEVTAVEPDPGMRDRFAAVTPGPPALAGSAESVPLPDGYAEAVLVGQAYHWFDRERAHPEIARVLRPGGVFAAIWNLRDDRVGWVDELSRIAEIGDTVDHLREFMAGFGGPFTEPEWAEFPHVTALTPDELIAMVRTRSHYLVADRRRRARVEGELRDLFATHPDLAGRETIELPYRTLAIRAQTLRS